MFIGIGGCSRSGKTTVTHRIKDIAIAKDLRFKCIHQDDLLLPDEELPQVNGRIDWEKPESINLQKQKEIIDDAFSRKDIIVIEGIFVHPAFTPNIDKYIYLSIDKEKFLERRKEETRWGEEEAWYLDYVWDAHKDFYGKSIEHHFNGSNRMRNIEMRDAESISDEFLENLILANEIA